MKTNLKSNSILLGGLLLLGTVFSCTQAEQDYASYVNPFIGTGGHGRDPFRKASGKGGGLWFRGRCEAGERSVSERTHP